MSISSGSVKPPQILGNSVTELGQLGDRQLGDNSVTVHIYHPVIR
jgi:hypothetical protein